MGLDGASSIVTRARSQTMFKSLPASQDGRMRIMILGISVYALVFRSVPVICLWRKLIQAYAIWRSLMSKTVTHLRCRWALRWIAASCSCLKGCPLRHLFNVQWSASTGSVSEQSKIWNVFVRDYVRMCVWVFDLSLQGSRRVAHPGSGDDESSFQKLPLPPRCLYWSRVLPDFPVNQEKGKDIIHISVFICLWANYKHLRKKAAPYLVQYIWFLACSWLKSCKQAELHVRDTYSEGKKVK